MIHFIIVYDGTSERNADVPYFSLEDDVTSSFMMLLLPEKII